MGAVRGVLMDESLLFAEDENGNLSLPSAAATLLRRLQYSKLHVGICYQSDVSPQKETFIKTTASSYLFDCILLHGLHEKKSFAELMLAWTGVGETSFYVASRRDDEFFSELEHHGWKIICKSADGGMGLNNGRLFIDKLEELLITICSFSKMALNNAGVLLIGYVMKPSREEDFAKRGAFPMYPTQNGLMFVPLTFDLPLTSQIQQVDAVLHKATDEIISIDPYSLDFPNGISFSKGMSDLERYIGDDPNCCMIDPIDNIYPLLDRNKIQQILLGLEDLNVRDHSRLRAPHFLKVDNFQGLNLKQLMSEANLYFPAIVKPQVACGAANAHNMALVFKPEDFESLDVPLPAIVQEYVDHGSLLFKFYVLGGEVFHAVKKSMPNAIFLLSLYERNGFAPITFNSLKSLPVANESQPSVAGIKADGQSLDLELVNSAARWLRQQLGLTVFGFDVVIQESSGDHVIVDLNYLPSFKEVPDGDAIPAFWDAIKSSYELKRKTN